AFPTRFGAPHAACRGWGSLVRADLSAWAPDRSLQRGSAPVVPRCDRRTATASPHWPCDLEAGATWRLGESFWWISNRAKHSPYNHVPDRRIHSRPCGSGGHFPTYTRLDDRGNAGGAGKPKMNLLRRMPVVKY